MNRTIDDILRRAAPAAASGRVATYIPELGKADPSRLGIALASIDGGIETAGDADITFTIQSVSKVFALAYVLAERGEEAVFARVGKEPTGDPFNSIIRLETSARRKPFNPFINAGAIVISSMMPGADAGERSARFHAWLARLLGREAVGVDEAVYRSEKATGARNRAIAWFLKELGLLEGEVEDALDGYFRQCATLLTAVDLARTGAILAADGLDRQRGRLLDAGHARVIKSLMVTCGMYDGSGEFAVDVGVPAKSGVGGGIMATVRGRMGIGIYGPALDERGNSSAGVEALRLLSETLDLSVL